MQPNENNLLSIVDLWKNNRPKKFFPKAVKLFGPADFVANVPNGMAYWKCRTNSLFSEHYIKDQEISHCVPAKHYDYFYSSIKCYVPPELRLAVLSISGSINYDGLTKLLTARCASLEANIATLYLGMCVANRIMDIKDVKKQGLYGKYIRGEMQSHSELKKAMKRIKTTNNNKYKIQIAGEFDPLAFTNC
jgi:hypothetical protein